MWSVALKQLSQQNSNILQRAISLILSSSFSFLHFSPHFDKRLWINFKIRCPSLFFPRSSFLFSCFSLAFGQHSRIWQETERYGEIFFFFLLFSLYLFFLSAFFFFFFLSFSFQRNNMKFIAKNWDYWRYKVKWWENYWKDNGIIIWNALKWMGKKMGK